MADSLQVLFAGVNAGEHYLEAGELDRVCSEDELVGINGDSMVSTEVEPGDCLKEALGEVVGPEQGIVDAFGLVWYVGDKFVESP